MKEHVRERYATIARTLAEAPGDAPATLGVGDPVSLAELRPGETVVDLGSGPGRDLLAAARAVGPAGRAVGIDMTAEMRDLARAAAAEAGLENLVVLDGDLERLPLPCGAADVVVSNCVINLVPDKRRALVEAFRVLRPGGRLAVVDTAFETEPPAAVREDPDAWSCCVGGALVRDDYETLLGSIGFQDVSVEFLDASCGGEACSVGDVTAKSVAVRARKPGTAADGIAIRPAVPADRSAIQRLLRNAGLSSSLPVEEATVALDDGEVVGVVGLERYGQAALLRSLAVDPERRRGGIGTKLVIATLEIARWAGAREVFLMTNDAQAFFERFGFVAVSRKRAGTACASEQFADAECETAIAMGLDFETADLPLLGRPSRKDLPTFQNGACC